MKVKLRRIGNSWGAIIPRKALEGFELGDEIEIEVRDPKKIPQKIENFVGVMPVKSEESYSDKFIRIANEMDQITAEDLITHPEKKSVEASPQEEVVYVEEE